MTDPDTLAAIRAGYENGTITLNRELIGALLAMLDAANSDIKKWRYSNQQDHNVINAPKWRIAELEADRASYADRQTALSKAAQERDALRAALAEAPHYDNHGTWDRRADYKLWYDRTREQKDWRDGAHMEGVKAENETVHAVMKQCQRDNGRLRTERDALRAALAEATRERNDALRQNMADVGRIAELEAALKDAVKCIDELMPGIAHIAPDIKFINETLIKSRKLI